MGNFLIKQWHKLRFTLITIAIMWIVLGLSAILPLRQFGIHPRSLDGLFGIFTAPFLHGDYQHLAANTPMLLVLGWLIQNLEPRRFWVTLLGITVLAGLGTWLIGGGNENHIGASGVIYGLLGYTLAIGFFSRRAGMIAVSIAMAALYGGAIEGILPAAGQVSWEGHLSGFLGGIGMAKVMGEARPRPLV